ncbi:hypothetical protein [Mariprofundus sp. NF]|nr:hypothetical protein [Mariprofundus sp. NF]
MTALHQLPGKYGTGQSLTDDQRIDMLFCFEHAGIIERKREGGYRRRN